MENCKAYSFFILVTPLTMVAVDYVAVVIAAYLSVYFRNGIMFMTGTVLHIPAVKIYVLIPMIYILFLQAQRLYTVREPFYGLMRRIFMLPHMPWGRPLQSFIFRIWQRQRRVCLWAILGY